MKRSAVEKVDWNDDIWFHDGGKWKKEITGNVLPHSNITTSIRIRKILIFLFHVENNFGTLNNTFRRTLGRSIWGWRLEMNANKTSFIEQEWWQKNSFLHRVRKGRIEPMFFSGYIMKEKWAEYMKAFTWKSQSHSTLLPHIRRYDKKQPFV